MRWSTKNGPKCIDAPVTTDPPRRSRAECADWVVLARRMSIPDDHAIRQFVDVTMGLTGEHHPPRS